MTFSRVNTHWNVDDVLTSAQQNQLDLDHSQALDCGAGGTGYTPTGSIAINVPTTKTIRLNSLLTASTSDGGTVTCEHALIVEGATTTEAITANDDISCTGNISAVGVTCTNLTVTGDFSVSGDLTVTGDTNALGDVIVTGGVTIAEGLTVTGGILTDADLTVAGGLGVSGTSDLGDTTVTGDLDVSGVSTGRFLNRGTLGPTSGTGSISLNTASNWYFSGSSGNQTITVTDAVEGDTIDLFNGGSHNVTLAGSGTSNISSPLLPFLGTAGQPFSVRAMFHSGAWYPLNFGLNP